MRPNPGAAHADSITISTDHGIGAHFNAISDNEVVWQQQATSGRVDLNNSPITEYMQFAGMRCRAAHSSRCSARGQSRCPTQCPWVAPQTHAPSRSVSAGLELGCALELHVAAVSLRG